MPTATSDLERFLSVHEASDRRFLRMLLISSNHVAGGER
jgi:hypothetical protein